MRTYSYHETDLTLETAQFLDSKKELKLIRWYNKNTDLSSICVTKKFRVKGLLIFYCNNLSNLDEIQFWFGRL